MEMTYAEFAADLKYAVLMNGCAIVDRDADEDVKQLVFSMLAGRNEREIDVTVGFAFDNKRNAFKLYYLSINEMEQYCDALKNAEDPELCMYFDWITKYLHENHSHDNPFVVLSGEEDKYYPIVRYN